MYIHRYMHVYTYMNMHTHIHIYIDVVDTVFGAWFVCLSFHHPPNTNEYFSPYKFSEET